MDELPRWLGIAIPRRHAKRAVTRSLLKRQIREQFRCHAPNLAAGAWVVRLRAPIERQVFVSAASTRMRRTAADEIDTLMKSATRQRARGLA